MNREDDQLIEQFDPTKAARLTLDVEAYALHEVLNRAARMVADRVWEDMHSELEKATTGAMDKAVAERMEPLIAEIVNGVPIDDLGECPGGIPLCDRIADAFKTWATERVDRDGKPWRGSAFHSGSEEKLNRLTWFIKQQVGGHMEKQASAAVADLKDGARKIATDILAAAIQQRLPKGIEGL